jgi:ATP-dependent DNA helicase RecG
MPSKPKFDPRKMMEKAVEAMKQSINEPREDGKASPLVGAVLVKPDGAVDSAFRGELRHGDHAEFTLLERKHRGDRLDGSVVFATLEPCAPGARKHPKLSCAERIVNARVSEVWIGIEDPDPTVDREGIRFLESNGIKVYLFDRDLQDEIREANEAFIVQALDRAAVAKEKKTIQPVLQSRWDDVQPDAGVADFSGAALSRYRLRTKIRESVGSDAFLARLQRQGLVRRHGRKLRPTGFGVVLFGKRPREIIHHAGLNLTIEYPDGTHEVADFDGPAILIPDAIEKWLKPKLPNVIDRSQMTHGQIAALPFELIRESVNNALIHRNYDLTGATCHLVVSANTVLVRSPGEPLAPVTTEQLQAFTAPMYNRNPKLQFAFGGSKLVEGRGLGMRTLGEAATKHGLPVPKYDFDGLYLNLTIYLHARAALDSLGDEVLSKLTKSEKEGWEWLASKGMTSSGEYARGMKLAYRTAMNHLKKFLDLGLLERTGSARATEYKVRKPGVR